MEYNEASDNSSNLESDSSTGIHERDALLNEIAKLQKKISELEDTSTMKKQDQKEFMRLLVAKRLYYLCSTVEYHDMPFIEINKCIDK
ncbi:10005_t:CDS:2, partial [Gigaspora rosea]